MHGVPKCQITQSSSNLILLSLTLLSLSLGVYTPAHAQPKQAATHINNVVGIWRAHNGDKVQFYKCGPHLCGKLISTRSRLKRDRHNPNPKFRKRALKGITIIRSRKKTGPKKWVGRVYNIYDGKTYHGSLQLTGTKTAKLTGCMSMGLCQSATWKKISKSRVTALKK